MTENEVLDIDLIGGAIESPHDSRDYQASELLGSEDVDLPSEYYLPRTPIQNQGATMHCTSYALAKVFEVYNAIEHNKEIDFDPEKQWTNQLIYPATASEKVGDYTRSALKSLIRYGLEYMGYNFPILGYAVVKNTKEEFMKYLAKGMSIYTSCNTYMPGEKGKEAWTTWSYARKEGVAKFGGKNKGSGHAIACCIGYNEEGAIFENSYGKWGIKSDGSFIIRWEDLDYLHTSFILFDEKDVLKSKREILLAIRQMKIEYHLAEKNAERFPAIAEKMEVIKKNAHEAAEILRALLQS